MQRSFPELRADGRKSTQLWRATLWASGNARRLAHSPMRREGGVKPPQFKGSRHVRAILAFITWTHFGSHSHFQALHAPSWRTAFLFVIV